MICVLVIIIIIFVRVCVVCAFYVCCYGGKVRFGLVELSCLEIDAA
jgi:hypothetical protein